MKHRKKHITKKRNNTKRRRFNRHRTTKKYDGGINIRGLIISALLGQQSYGYKLNPNPNSSFRSLTSNSYNNFPAHASSTNKQYVSQPIVPVESMEPSSLQIDNNRNGKPPPPPTSPPFTSEDDQENSKNNDDEINELLLSFKNKALKIIIGNIKELLIEKGKDKVIQVIDSVTKKIIATVPKEKYKQLKISKLGEEFLINGFTINTVIVHFANLLDPLISDSNYENELQKDTSCLYLLKILNYGYKNN